MPRTRLKPLRFRRCHHFVYACLACILIQAPSRATPAETGEASTLARLTALRDTYTARIKADGFSCPIAPPAIVIDHTPSFGNYDDTTNILHMSSWGELSAEERGLFFRMAGPQADEDAAHAKFEEGIHHFVFVHEMGHWWQACRHALSARNNYKNEYGANRIAIAYWREADPALANRMVSVFRGMVDHVPSPVPQGQEIATYFNSHYEQLGHSPDYVWYQSYMNVAAAGEKPEPSFAKALAETRP